MCFDCHVTIIISFSFPFLSPPLPLLSFPSSSSPLVSSSSCRINRILEAPRGNALLVGVGGSGKQSLTRLAASVSGLEVFQIQLRKGYGVNDLRAELAQLYIKAGLKNIGTVFLLTDAQVRK